MSDFNQQVIEEFRANDGKVGGNFEGAPLLLLTTTGAKTGERRTQPVMHFDLDEGRFIVASAAGADRHPAWFHNLMANPAVTVEVGAETYEAHAAQVGEDARAALWPKVVERMPAFAEYEQKTARVIPMVELSRV
jgi:deazaflavin-dependent oxidoreductase (nitroreductase family)